MQLIELRGDGSDLVVGDRAQPGENRSVERPVADRSCQFCDLREPQLGGNNETIERRAQVRGNTASEAAAMAVT